MKIEKHISINAPQKKIWKIITNFENSYEFIKSVKKVTVLEKTPNTLLGLKWEESRTFVEKKTIEITDTDNINFYQTQSSNRNISIKTDAVITQSSRMSKLTYLVEILPNSRIAKIKFGLLGFAHKMIVKLSIKRELADIKEFVESKR